jgi:hypothetical protein
MGSLLPFLLILGLVAPHAHAAVAQTPTPDEKALALYRLTMPTLKKVFGVLQSIVEEAARDPRAQELVKVKGQMEILQMKDELTEAGQAELDKLTERESALEEEIDRARPSRGDNATLADMEKNARADPTFMRALAREGLTPREFSLTMMAMLQASLVEGFSQGKVDLKRLPPGVNPDNVLFVREHKAELEAMQKTMAGASKK